MKFTMGYWLMKPEIRPLYAVEYVDHEIIGNDLVVYAAERHVPGRGDAINIGLLTITLSAPKENVIGVDMAHFTGKDPVGPFPKLNTDPVKAVIEETEEELIYHSGDTKAVVSKRAKGWGIRYYRGEKLLTETGWRNMAYMTNTQTGRCDMVEQLLVDVGEKIYGLGERFTPFVKNGQSVSMWNGDGGTASELAYKNIPFYITSKGYGIYVHDLSDVNFEICSEKVEYTQFSVQGEYMTYFVIGGKDAKETLKIYTDLTGKPALPPEWSFGLWLSTSFKPSYDEGTTSTFINGMAEHEIPLSVFHFDCYWMKTYKLCNMQWDEDVTKDPGAMLGRLHARGIKVCQWINPYISQKSELFEEGKKGGYFIQKLDGSPWQTDLWQPGMAIVDFTNPEATAWFQSKLKVLTDFGVDVFKTDFGERIPVKGIKYFDGSDPLKMHNQYTFLYNKAVFELLQREKGETEALLFARSATVGGQQFPVHWGGDCLATYPSMAETLRGGLSLSCGGFGYWSHDISGFESTATPDLYKRWCQFGLFSSHSRLHGSDTYRVPWLFDEESCDVLKEVTELKCSLMPYLYAQAVTAHEDGTPMMRPMFMEFPEDHTCETLDLQYMMGDSLLVAPIFNPDGMGDYYLPDGEWINLFTKEIREGGRWIREKFDYHSFPLMVRKNSVLAIGEHTEKPDYDYTKNVKFAISVFDDGAETSITVPNADGSTAMTANVSRSGNTITVTVTGGDAFTCELLEDATRQFVYNGNTAVCTL